MKIQGSALLLRVALCIAFSLLRSLGRLVVLGLCAPLCHAWAGLGSAWAGLHMPRSCASGHAWPMGLQTGAVLPAAPCPQNPSLHLLIHRSTCSCVLTSSSVASAACFSCSCSPDRRSCSRGAASRTGGSVGAGNGSNRRAAQRHALLALCMQGWEPRRHRLRAQSSMHAHARMALCLEACRRCPLRPTRGPSSCSRAASLWTPHPSAPPPRSCPTWWQ